MKSVLFAALVALSHTASAAPVRIGDCNGADFQKIWSSLKKLEITAGSEFKSELESILAQEMGPTCSRLLTVELPPLAGVMSAYEIDNRAGDVFYISIVEASELKPDSLTIERK